MSNYKLVSLSKHIKLYKLIMNAYKIENILQANTLYKHNYTL